MARDPFEWNALEPPDVVDQLQCCLGFFMLRRRNIWNMLFETIKKWKVINGVWSYIKGILKDLKHKTWLWNRKGHFWTFVNLGQREPKSLMVSHWLWCLCRHAFQVGPVCLHVCGFSLIKLSARLPRSQVALVVTALSSRRLLLVVEIVETVEEIVERVAAGITSCSTVVTALTTELSTWLPRTLQLVPARARLGPTTLPKKYRNENTQKW